MRVEDGVRLDSYLYAVHKWGPAQLSIGLGKKLQMLEMTQATLQGCPHYDLFSKESAHLGR